MKKLLLITISFLSFKSSIGQDSTRIKLVDSLINKAKGFDTSEVIIKKDTGSIVMPHTNERIGHYKNEFKIYKALGLTTVNRTLHYFKDSKTIYDVFYFIGEELYEVSTYYTTKDIKKPVSRFYFKDDKVLNAFKLNGAELYPTYYIEDADLLIQKLKRFN